MTLRKKTSLGVFEDLQDDAYEAGLDGKGLDKTELGQLVVRSGLLERDRGEAERHHCSVCRIARPGQAAGFRP